MQLEFHKQGIIVSEPGQIRIYGWSYVAATVIFLFFALVITISIARQLYYRYRKDIWVRTTAQILDNEQIIGLESQRTRRGEVVYPDFRIAYYANDRRIEAHLNGAHMIGCIDVVDIEYRRDNPHICRKALIPEE